MPDGQYSFFDFDNTIYKGHSHYLILDFAIFLEGAGRFHPAELEKIRSLFSAYYDGRINRHEFGFQVVECYYHGIADIPEDIIRNSAHQFWKWMTGDAWFSYTIPLLKILGSVTAPILISGSPIEILEAIRKPLGFKDIFASKGIIQNGVYTGQTMEEIATSSAKERLMRVLAGRLSFNPSTSFAFGDSESDYPLLRSVDPANAYLIGPIQRNIKPEVDKHWNFLENEKELLDSVNSRIHRLFPQT